MNEIQKLTTKELTDELTRRIKSNEVRFDTEYTKTYYGDDSTEVIYSLVWKENGKDKQWIIQDLLEEQHKRDEDREEKEIEKDNNRPEVWEKMKGLMNFSLEIKGGGGNKGLKVECKQCGKMDEHVYLNGGEGKRINGLEMYKDIKSSTIPDHQIDNILSATSLSMIEYEGEAHVVQGHESTTRAGTEERKKFPKYDEGLKSRNEGLWKARIMNG